MSAHSNQFEFFSERNSLGVIPRSCACGSDPSTQLPTGESWGPWIDVLVHFTICKSLISIFAWKSPYMFSPQRYWGEWSKWKVWSITGLLICDTSACRDWKSILAFLSGKEEVLSIFAPSCNVVVEQTWFNGWSWYFSEKSIVIRTYQPFLHCCQVSPTQTETHAFWKRCWNFYCLVHVHEGFQQFTHL